jgi:hypothetical protein
MREFRTKEGRFPLRLMYDIKEIDDICLSALRQAKLLPSEPEAIKIDLFLEKYFEVPLLYEDLGEGVMGSTVFDSRGKVTGFTVAPWIEEEANRAIGGLLLPKPLVLKLVEPLLETGEFGKVLSAGKRPKAESDISEVFDVNPVVARIRLQEMFPLDGQKLL